MKRIGKIREEIYNHFHNSESCERYFFDKTHGDEYAQYYTAMYLLQDSTEGLCKHREKGFSNDPSLAYIEVVGVLQAIIIQQDSIETIIKTLGQIEIAIPEESKWKEIRNLRNLCAGHPVNKGEKIRQVDTERSFMGRDFGGYDELRIEVWNKEEGKTEFRNIKLGQLIDDYAEEAANHLTMTVNLLPSKWP